MTDAAVDTDAHNDHGHDDHAHPTEKSYWIVFLILAVVTALEVAWSYLGLEGPALVIPLIVMMVFKFLVVAGVFMHLYFDLKMLNGNVFTMAFGSAMVLALIVYFVVFASFDVVF